MKTYIYLALIMQALLFIPVLGMSNQAIKTVQPNFDNTAKDTHLDAQKKHATRRLYTAVGNHNIQGVKEWIAHGADVTVVDENGHNPLLLATTNKYYDLLPDLLAAGSSPNTRDQHNSPVLHYAVRDYVAKRCDGRVVAKLVESGANILNADANGNTALHILVSAGLRLDNNEQAKVTNLIKYLLARGIQRNPRYAYAQNTRGETIFDYAANAPQTTIGRLLNTF